MNHEPFSHADVQHERRTTADAFSSYCHGVMYLAGAFALASFGWFLL